MPLAGYHFRDYTDYNFDSGHPRGCYILGGTTFGTGLSAIAPWLANIG